MSGLSCSAFLCRQLCDDTRQHHPKKTVSSSDNRVEECVVVVAEENHVKEIQSRRKEVKSMTEEALNVESLRVSCLQDIVQTTRYVWFDFLTDLHERLPYDSN